MLYEVITGLARGRMGCDVLTFNQARRESRFRDALVITSYSIHYTKLYEGWRLEVITTVTPRSNSRSNRRPTIIASVMSVICISSKARTLTVDTTLSATGPISYNFV